jgi:type I restriction enzyme R subunit
VAAAKSRMDEDSYAEQPALEWLTGFDGLKWEYVHGAEIAPNGPAPERESWDDVALVDRLRAALIDLNPTTSRHAVELAISKVLDTASPDPIRDHADFHELLVGGVGVTVLEDGEERAVRVRLVDWDQPGQNDFLAVNQFRIVIGSKNRRPDILLFVNGLPLAQLEVKDPGNPTASPEGAVNQVAHYVETIPKLYRYVELVGVSDLLRARLGTITTPAEHFAEWKTMDPAEGEGRPALDVLIDGVFRPDRFLDLIRHFVLFEEHGAKLVKVVAKYHQVDAVNRAVEAAASALGAGGRAGVVWHTQGSGKSYTMVFTVGKLRDDRRFANPTIVLVTDRTDLDTQLHDEVFKRQKALRDDVEQADSIVDLRERLQRPAGGIVFTTIQKFQSSDGPMPVLSERRNVIVIADEAHRTQYAKLAANVTIALPNATRIGFTGTPIETGDRSTQVVFGDLISVYRMERAVEDGATVPIYYENRRVPLEVADQELLEEVETTLTGEEDEAAAKLISAWTRLERVVGTGDRLVRVADDIAEHFQDGAMKSGGKAMVVAMSQRIAADLTRLLQQRLGEDATTCVISASATDDPAISTWRRSSAERKQVETDFKDPEHPLRLVVVRDMWLTGFDVPSLYSIYIDKPMRDHGLLQAIARVNRVFRDKSGGLVIDYIGIGDDLKASLAAYSAKDVDDAAIPLAVAIGALREKHDVVSEFFHGIAFRLREQLGPAERAIQFQAAFAAVIKDDETKKRFLSEYAAFSRLFKLLRANPAAIVFEHDEEFFRKVAGAVTKISPPEGHASPEAEQAVKQFVSEGLSAGEIVDVFELAGEERPEISILSDEFLDNLTHGISQPSVGLAILKKILNDEIRVRQRTNQMQAKLFSDELQSALARYEARQITSAEVIARLVEIAKKMREARHRHEALGLTVEEAAFYDALAANPDDWQADPKLAEIARDLVKSIRDDLAPDWASHEATESAIRAKIKRLLRRHDYQVTKTGGAGRSPDKVADLILGQARTLYRMWPDVWQGELLL